jgi:glyoxylase-like metal-dependent hydrolase (beta-lactamase superfamily II)
MNYPWERLADGVHRCRLPFLDVTIGLVVGPSEVLLIDCGTTLTEATALAADVDELAGRGVSQLVLTHHHFDHVLGSSVFTGAVVYAAPTTVAAMTTGTEGLRTHALSYGASEVAVDEAIAALRAPQRQVLSAVIDLGDRQVHIEHLGRGHTDQDLIVVVPARRKGGSTVVFCGDLVEESGDPMADADSDSDLGQWPATLDAILAIGGSDAVYVPGHGAAVDAGFIARQRDWLRVL